MARTLDEGARDDPEHARRSQDVYMQKAVKRAAQTVYVRGGEVHGMLDAARHQGRGPSSHAALRARNNRVITTQGADQGRYPHVSQAPPGASAPTMASRTKQKEEARARRLAEEQARAERARRDRRIRMVGGIVLAAVVLVGILIAVSSSGGKKSGLQHGGAANGTIAAVTQMFAGIPQSGPTLGNPKAPVTMTYFGDYECPVCQAFTLQGGFPQLVANDVRAGKVKVVYKSFCTATCNGPNPNIFTTQQAAGLAAGQQNKFWYFTELFYREQGQEDTGYVTQSYLNGLAQQVPGLNMSAWQTALDDPTLAAQVTADQNDARTLGVSGTPTLILQGPKGQAAPSASVPTYAQLEQAIKQVA
jgi:protein-disulfide isomerase